jgi:hypothetical protein
MRRLTRMKWNLIAATSICMTMTSLSPHAGAATFGDDVAFLKGHLKDLIVLSDAKGQAKVALAPGYQGRVMTSTAGGDAGISFGWINREFIAAGKLVPHMNAFGGEERFWLGPEGGQFSIFFPKGAKFEFNDWQTPPPIDSLPFKVVRKSTAEAEFAAEFSLTNYSGTQFHLDVARTVRLLDTAAAWNKLGVPAAQDVSLIAFESDNKITNAGKKAWEKESGLLSIWILSMFNPGPSATIVAPIKPGPESELGVKVTSDYFGSIPADRLVVKDNVIFLSADGKYRSKIGLNPKRSKAVLGAYDADTKVLTIAQFTQPASVTDYVNSLWKLQDKPYGGDAANSYNDGPATPGAKPMGPFFELESSSPAAALAPGKSLSHIHRTIHLSGPEPALDKVARATLGVSLDEIKAALKTK